MDKDTFYPYVIQEKNLVLPDVFMLKVQPQNGSEIFDFEPGQFCDIKNPTYEKAEEVHMFSIASSPNTRTCLELWIKIYGTWTKTLSEKNPGEILNISGPHGRFKWEACSDAVFLSGGIGITPMLSMMRYLHETKTPVHLVLVNGNRSLSSAVCLDEINSMCREEQWKHVQVLSEVGLDDLWTGYRGFVTDEILQKEIDFSANPTFYLCGPPIFIHSMIRILRARNIPPQKIKEEVF